MNVLVGIIFIFVLAFMGVMWFLLPLTRVDKITSKRLENMGKDFITYKLDADGETVNPEINLEEAEKNNKKDETIKKFAEWVNSHSTQYSKKKLTKDDNEVKKMLAVANVNISLATFSIFRIALGIVFAFITYVIAVTVLREQLGDFMVLALAGAFGLLGTLAPKEILKGLAKRRRQEIVKSMSNCIDLLAVSVEAGMGYDQAILRIWERDKSPAMQEIVRTMLDINHGLTRQEAYSALAARCGVDEMSQFANNMAQADNLGISIVNVLKAQAEALRDARRLRAETFIQKAPIKLTLPLVLCIFPAIFVVVLAPALVSLSEVF